MKDKNLPPSNLPREKLLRTGPEYLTNSELLSIILGSGTKSQDVFSMSNKVFPTNSLTFPILTLTPQKISNELNIPMHHALKLSALFALLERLKNSSGVYILTSNDIYRQFYHIAPLKKENLIAVYLDSRNRKILDDIITIGSINQSLFPISEILSVAVNIRATAIAVIHNHPSGDPQPSKADIDMTRKLKEACKLFDIFLLDHVIISEGKYYSFTENGVI